MPLDSQNVTALRFDWPGNLQNRAWGHRADYSNFTFQDADIDRNWIRLPTELSNEMVKDHHTSPEWHRKLRGQPVCAQSRSCVLHGFADISQLILVFRGNLVVEIDPNAAWEMFDFDELSTL